MTRSCGRESRGSWISGPARSVTPTSMVTYANRTHLQRRGAQWLHFITLSKHIITAKVAEYERVAAVKQSKTKAAATARPRGRCRDRPPLHSIRATQRQSTEHGRNACTVLPECMSRSMPVGRRQPNQKARGWDVSTRLRRRPMSSS